MTEIAVRHNGNTVDVHNGQDQAIARLAEWAQAADAAYAMAQKLCGTQFSPAAYRGKPEEATAAILAGAEVGLSPMAALRAFDNIQGTPAPKAMTLRAIVQAQGHEIRIDESTPTQAAVSGRRRGDTSWQTSTWTIERAREMGLTGKQQWKAQPGAMLVARATAEVCRWIASDAIMGMGYSAEEVRDEGPSFEGRPAPLRVTAAEIIRSAEPQPTAPQPAAQAGTEPQQPDGEPVALQTAEQRKRMFGLWDDLGYAGDANREQRLVITAKILGLSEPLTSSSDLTSDEMEQLNDALQVRRDEQRKQQAVSA